MRKIIKIITLIICLSFVSFGVNYAQDLTQQLGQSQQQLLAEVKQLQNQSSNAVSQANATVSNLQGKLYNTVSNATSSVNPANQTSNSNPNTQTQSNPVSQSNIGSTFTRPSTVQFAAPFDSAQVPQSSQTRAITEGAFNSTVQGLLPMSPSQIHRLKQLYTASQFAAAAPAGVPPRPTATSLFVDLSPGGTPPAINLSEGDVTALVFLDSTGSPWPIAAIDNGNPNSFNIQWNKKDNVLMVQALSAFGRGNLAVRLKGLGPPIMISLITNTTMENGGGVVDYRVDLRVPGFGPEARPYPVAGLPSGSDPILLDVLDGIPPPGGKALHVADDVGYAWLLGDKLYLRTRLTLLSPGWLQTMSSADGTNAYQVQATPLLLMAQNGKMIQVKLEGL